MQKTTLSIIESMGEDTHLSQVVMDLIKEGRCNSSDELEDLILSSQTVQSLLLFFNYTFNDTTLLLEALTHTSFVHENRSLVTKSNEKVEFLGDSILGYLVSTHLYLNFPKLTEGDLSKFRGSLVNESCLAELARFLDLGNCLLVGKGEFQSLGYEKEALLADAFEAFIGSIYLDGGYELVKAAFLHMLEKFKLKTGSDYICLDRLVQFDAKSRLQELTMALYKEFPKYSATQLEDNTFMVELRIKDKLVGAINATSKKKAQRELANTVLKDNLYKEL